MGQKRCGMKAIRQILELARENSLSLRLISQVTGVSRPVVKNYIDAFAASGIGPEELAAMPDSELLARLTVKSHSNNSRHQAALEFYPYMLTELARPGVTRKLLWQEYSERHPDGYLYTQFCVHFARWRKAEPEVTTWVEHKAGDRMYVDFSGKKPSYFDPATGLTVEAELFVAVLGASQYAYVEATPSQRKADWLVANRNALEFFGGVPASIMPDCLKSAVTKGDKYAPDINPEYAEFARHYGTVIVPARPHCPRDKALVEGTVNIAYTRILAPLRNRIFHSLEELNEAIRPLLLEHNRKRFQKMPHSRAELFETVDRPAMKPLPARRYELVQYRMQKVQINYHVELREDGHYYSVPWRYAGKKVTVACTERTVDIYYDNARIAFHNRLPAGQGPRYVTLREHMPSHHQFYREWSRERIESWAGQIGLNVRSLVSGVMDRAEHPEQAFKSCIGIISFSKKYTAARLDLACRIAASEHGYGYKAVKRILDSGRDCAVSASERLQPVLSLEHENVRGQSAYQ